MKLPRFGRFLSGAGGDNEYKEYTPEEREQWNDEEWKRRRTENWWEKEERTKREADIKRAKWVVSDPLTPEEEQKWEHLKYNNDLYTAEEKTEKGKTWKVWVFKDANIEAEFNALDKKKKEYDDTYNYFVCRLAPREYYEVKDRVLRDGIGKRWVRFETQSDTGFKYIKVDFPSDYKWLLNNEVGRAKQAVNPAGYHITICYDKTYESDPEAKKATDAFAEKYWGWQEIEMKDISISSGDTYQIEGDSEFAEDLRKTVAITLDKPNYKAHISMD